MSNSSNIKGQPFEEENEKIPVNTRTEALLACGLIWQDVMSRISMVTRCTQVYLFWKILKSIMKPNTLWRNCSLGVIFGIIFILFSISWKVHCHSAVGVLKTKRCCHEMIFSMWLEMYCHGEVLILDYSSNMIQVLMEGYAL